MNPDISKILIQQLSVNELTSTLVVDLHPFLEVEDKDLILGYARSVRPVTPQIVFSDGDHSVSIVCESLLSYVPSKTGHNRWQLNSDLGKEWTLLNEAEYPVYGEFLKFVKQYPLLYLSLYNPKHIEQLDLAMSTLQAESLGVASTGTIGEINDRCMQKINQDFEKFFEA